MQTSFLTPFMASLWTMGGGYVGMFVGMLIEGPAITVLAAFAARVGLFNIWIVLILSILGNFLPDILFYAIGFWGRPFIDKYGHRIGIKKERIELIEKLYQDHPFKTLLVVKLVPFLPPTGLTAAGASHMSLKKYSFWSLIITAVTFGGFLGIGYYLGEAYIRFAAYQGYALTAIAIAIILIAYCYKKLTAHLGNKLAPAELYDKSL